MSHSFRHSLTLLLLVLVRRLNPSKDRRLSRLLHDVADEYDTRPTGAWK